MRKHKVKKTSTKTEKKEYSCPKCTFFTYKKSNLTRHERNCRKVKEQKEHVCNVCAKVFIKKFNFTRHMTTHDKEQRKEIFGCQVCEKVFTRLQNLRSHEKNKHSVQKVKTSLGFGLFEKEMEKGQFVKTPKSSKAVFKCEKCSYMTENKSNFNRHRKEKHSMKKNGTFENV